MEMRELRPVQSGPADRRAEENERRRMEILNAAEAVAKISGWEALTMIEVARQARVSRALVYLHFQDKSDLQLGVAERAVRTLSRRLSEVGAREARGINQLLAMVRAGLATDRATATQVLVAHRRLRVPKTGAGRTYTAYLAAVASCIDSIAGALESGHADRSIEVDVGSRELVAALLWEFICGALRLKALGQHAESDLDELAAQLVDRCVGRGMTTADAAGNVG